VPTIRIADLDRMRTALLFEGPERGKRLSRFWMLLVLASVIATAGVIGDSTATVIGAMIVAPLMTPILGTVLSIVTSDRVNLVRSVEMVVLGAASVIAIGWLIGHFTAIPIVAATNSQVASRVHPHLVDLLAALATGAVGAFALVRDDISDTLPGVAIAISLVPPLAVVGLTLESHAPRQALGALILFLTNVVAILMSGVIVMAAYHANRVAEAAGASPGTTPGTGVNRQRAAVTIVALVVIVAVPLTVSSIEITTETLTVSHVTSVASAWASRGGWQVVSVDSEPEGILVRAAGPLPEPDPHALRRDLDADGLRNVHVVLAMVPETQVDLPGG